MSKLGQLEADIQAVTQGLARISSDAAPVLPASLHQAMAVANSRKRKSCDVSMQSEILVDLEAKRGQSLDGSSPGQYTSTHIPFTAMSYRLLQCHMTSFFGLVWAISVTSVLKLETSVYEDRIAVSDPLLF